MKVKELQKKLVIRSVIYAVVLVGIAMIFIYLNNTNTQLSEDHDWLKNDIRSLSSKLEGLSKKALEFSEAVKIWEELSKDQRKLQGLRINYAKDLLDQYKEVYKLTDMKVSFSKPEELVEFYVSDTVAVISSNVSINFKGITDKQVFNFIAALLEGFPGYVQIKSFSVTRSKEVTKGALEKIASGKFPGLTVCKIEFIWRDLKYKGPISPESGSL